ncbi:hypothetical protein AC579_3281 [Pseudocercospora musae]|uniref:Uncharacterized protein n=1 Tax=Pseudocercospora musae TaxID=113226 RepID=A0A139ID86_9PEZI|nr:hypothetical protein AC579_3281 [Pseudocercospora musae]
MAWISTGLNSGHHYDMVPTRAEDPGSNQIRKHYSNQLVTTEPRYEQAYFKFTSDSKCLFETIKQAPTPHRRNDTHLVKLAEKFPSGLLKLPQLRDGKAVIMALVIQP